MTLLSDYRAKYPKYKDVDDATLGRAIYDKYYSEKLSFDEFVVKLSPTPREDYGTAPIQNEQGQFQVGGPIGRGEQAFVEKYIENPVAGAVEGAMALGTAAVADPYSSYVGAAAQARNPSSPVAGYQAKNAAQEAMTYQPRSEGGQQFMQGVGGVIESIADTVGDWEVPFTDTKIRELATGERALSNASDGEAVVNEQGQYQVGGPIEGQLEGRLMEMTPSLAQSALLATGMPASRGGTPPIKATVPVKGGARNVQYARDPWQTPQPKVAPSGRIEPMLDDMGQIKESITKGKADPRAAKYKLDPITKEVIDDPVAIAAGKTGWNNNVIQITKSIAEKAVDRINGLKMVKIAREGIEDLKRGATHRPDSVLGKSVMARYKILKREMLSAGVKIDDVAKKAFQGKNIKSARVMSRLDKKISEWGGVMDDTGTFQYAPGTPLYDLPAGQKLLQSIYNQAKALGDSPSGYQLHKFKQWTDTKIKTAKLKQEGLVGAPDRFIATWRADINNLLRKASDDYKQINLQYGETKGAIDGLADAFGGKRLYGEGAEEATGGIMRKWISNAPNRQPLINAITEADRIATKYGGVFGDSMEAQVQMANALNDLITVANPLSRSSLKADMSAASRAWTQPSHSMLEKVVEKGVEVGGKALGYSDDPLKALDAIEDLLRSSASK